MADEKTIKKIINPIVVIDKNDDIKTDKATKTVKRSFSFSKAIAKANAELKIINKEECDQ